MCMSAMSRPFVIVERNQVVYAESGKTCLLRLLALRWMSRLGGGRCSPNAPCLRIFLILQCIVAVAWQYRRTHEHGVSRGSASSLRITGSLSPRSRSSIFQDMCALFPRPCCASLDLPIDVIATVLNFLHDTQACSALCARASSSSLSPLQLACSLYSVLQFTVYRVSCTLKSLPAMGKDVRISLQSPGMLFAFKFSVDHALNLCNLLIHGVCILTFYPATLVLRRSTSS
ncbi:hypothetical protein EXIGLDRAFT_65956 [Exidia glandulosa HHB12029]|uniref:Uncharacterized protein n=1 Tax=Exidia glandulosa HHB12029 TaxID=1314781 RepID=A0A166BJ71_EXIGL|nr:hypothetical protein EXIGLDRAFT_65956 [Exidia glandulosa HHB12029]